VNKKLASHIACGGRSFLFFVCISVWSFSAAQAGGLFAPFAFDSAQVIPKGVRSLRVAGFTTEVNDKYSGDGSSVPLAYSFNKSVTWKDLIGTQPAGSERGEFKGGLESMGVNLDDSVGDSSGIVESRITSTVPVAAFGITDKLTVGVAFPIIYSNVNVSTGWAANSSFQERLDALAKNGYLNKTLSYEQPLQNVIATKLAGLGYKPLQNAQHTDLGDVTVGLKYQTYSDDEWAVAIAPRIVLPTGRVADPDKVVDIASGDGQTDLGIGSAVDYSPTHAFTTTLAASYVYQIESYKRMRIPVSWDESLSADSDPSTREKLGDIMGTSLAAKYTVEKLWTFMTGYSLQYKVSDEYTGDLYASRRYAALSKDTDQTMQAAQAGISFSTVPLYKLKQFDIPFEAALYYTSVFAGHNVSKLGLASFELISFF
jgi:hypothetical protein